MCPRISIEIDSRDRLILLCLPPLSGPEVQVPAPPTLNWIKPRSIQVNQSGASVFAAKPTQSLIMKGSVGKRRKKLLCQMCVKMWMCGPQKSRSPRMQLCNPSPHPPSNPPPQSSKCFQRVGLNGTTLSQTLWWAFALVSGVLSILPKSNQIHIFHR